MASLPDGLIDVDEKLVDLIARRVLDRLGLTEEELERFGPIPDDTYLSERRLSEIIDTSTSTLQSLRYDGGGPPFVKRGKSVRYRWGDVREWMNDRTRTSTSDPGTAAG